MSILPSTVEDLTRWNSVFSWFYLGALVVGVVSSAGIIYCGRRLQTDANTKIAEANKTAALANERAEELAQENLKIRQQLADRVLAGDAQKTFVNSVRHPGHVGTVTFIQDREAADYANDIFSALKEAGWSVGKNYRQPHDPDPRPRGVVCLVSKNPDPTVKSVINALEKAGANPRTEVVQAQGNWFLDIVVGSKPKD